MTRIVLYAALWDGKSSKITFQIEFPNTETGVRAVHGILTSASKNKLQFEIHQLETDLEINGIKVQRTDKEKQDGRNI